MDDYYVYLHRRKSDDGAFYVGKGRDRRAYRGDKSSRSSKWLNMANKYGWYVEIVFDSLDEDEAYELEINTILEMQYFNEPLVNHNAGGYGGKPCDFTKDYRERVSEGLKRYYSTHPSPRKGAEGLKVWENGRSDPLAWLNLDIIYIYYNVGLSYATLSRVFPEISKTVFRTVCEYLEKTGNPSTNEDWLSYSETQLKPKIKELPSRAVSKTTCYDVIENIEEFNDLVKAGFGSKAIGKKLGIPVTQTLNMRKRIKAGYEYDKDPVMSVIRHRLIAQAELLNEDNDD